MSVPVPVHNILRIDADPTSWELHDALAQAPAFSAPVVLQVDHPLAGYLVLSPRSVGSAVFHDFNFVETFGTRPNGGRLAGKFLYLPSPTGLDMHSIPPNIYILPDAVDLAAQQADIIAAMTGGTFLTVNVTGGEVVINGAALPFAVLGPPNS